ncbi:MAG: hypothetical protein H0T42_06980 [Deltaproteobacteria bacterium]|nr:hypothetical protein [Deltaproteobacteria bacterium]
MKAIALVLTFGLATAAHADPTAVTRESDPPKPIKSLRAEGARIIATMEIGERFPMVSPIITLDGSEDFGWNPRGRAGNLHAAAMGATFVGEMLLGLGASPFAAIGALAVGATLDAAASDAAHDQESVRPVRSAR